MRRALECIAADGARMRGVLHEAHPGRYVPGEAALLLPGLVGTRVGPARIQVEMADLLASHGISTMRCDPVGTGYSDGDPGSTTVASIVRDVGDMLAFLRDTLGAERFLLGGVCRGAKGALAASMVHPEVTRLLLVSCPPFRSEDLGKRAARRRRYHLRHYARQLAKPGNLRRLARGEIHLGLVAKTVTRPMAAGALDRMTLGEGQWEMSSLRARTLFLYGEGDPDYRDSLDTYRTELAGKDETVTFRTIPEAGAGFYGGDWRTEAVAAVEKWLGGSADV